VAALRRLLAQRHLALPLLLATLLLKLLVPTGYMVAAEQGHIAIMLCPGTVPSPAAATMSSMHGMHANMLDHGKSKDHGLVEMPCAFAGLAAATLAAIDPALLIALIAFIMAIGSEGLALPKPLRRAFLRPPLRGPPAYP
jgi:hypothetical protein